ncbi:MAG TPA: 2-C-methyl-D-erythritol 2,4-cyclodiphosphate synthase [Desulfomonilaceae bacterium]|nr:2-C-methyl-D-erythritol 2,4-cyclodiphosphate synthase [Desulfomonilaceae bacterium]
MRVGQGFDVHKFQKGRKLILGGEKIDHPVGLQGHSDADVLVHALIDALLGAAGLGDIGMRFPDTDPSYRDASSIGMLKTVAGEVKALGFQVANVDVTIFAQNPRIDPFRASIIGNLAAAMKMEPERINVKATTTEGLGFVGRSEGMAAAAVVLLKSGDPQ